MSYLEWCNDNNFISKLPNDVKLWKENAERKGWQTTLDSHMKEKEQVIPYSDTLFNEVAHHWLIATDQVCCNPSTTREHVLDTVFIATAGVAAPIVPGNDPCCCPCHKWCED